MMTPEKLVLKNAPDNTHPVYYEKCVPGHIIHDSQLSRFVSAVLAAFRLPFRLCVQFTGYLLGLFLVFGYHKSLNESSQQLRVSKYYLATLGRMYEFTSWFAKKGASGCTTVVQRSVDTGIPYITSTMDWPLRPLKQFTYLIATEKGDSVDWTGSLGAFRVVRLNNDGLPVWAAAINFRPLGAPFWQLPGLFWQARQLSHWSPAELLRDVYENAKTYEDAVRRLACVPLKAPVYYTVVGFRHPEQAVILTRSCEGVDHADIFAESRSYHENLFWTPSWREQEEKLIQTNMDNHLTNHHFLPPKPDLSRFYSLTRKYSLQQITHPSLTEILSAPCVTNKKTLYACRLANDRATVWTTRWPHEPTVRETLHELLGNNWLAPLLLRSDY